MATGAGAWPCASPESQSHICRICCVPVSMQVREQVCTRAREGPARGRSWLPLVYQGMCSCEQLPPRHQQGLSRTGHLGGWQAGPVSSECRLSGLETPPQWTVLVILQRASNSEVCHIPRVPRVTQHCTAHTTRALVRLHLPHGSTCRDLPRMGSGFKDPGPGAGAVL